MPTAPVRRLDQNGDITFGRGIESFATGSEAAAQRARTRMLLIVGEWFLNTDAGVPWFQIPASGVQPIMGVTRNLPYTEAVLKARILGTDGIATLESFSMTFDGETRKLKVAAMVRTVDGDTVDINIVGPP
jgi:hypothetical protein